MDARIERAWDFMLLNARLLEHHLFRYYFLGGEKEPALAALRAYQNTDGGFGNALEPDKRCPESQPVDVQIALGILDDLDAFDDDMVGRVCDYLMSMSTPEGGVPFALPSVNNYPRAPWWTVPENPPASLNPTAAIAGLLLKHGVKHQWVGQATQYCWHALSRDAYMDDYHTLSPVILFLQYAPERERAEKELRRIANYLPTSGIVALDRKAEGYVQGPLDWAPKADSFTRHLFSDEVIATHLDALSGKQQADGGWPIKWDTISPAVTTEWRGWVTVEALKTLRSYGALADGL